MSNNLEINSDEMVHRKADFTVLISNGGNKFHLAPLASEIDQQGLLSGLITAGWPSKWQLWLASKFPQSSACRRFIDRKEQINESRVFSIPLSELFFQLETLFARSFPNLQRFVSCFGFYVYIYRACQIVKKLKPSIYHYRCCYGHQSVVVAGKMNSLSICDHSIAHPICLQWMENNRGEFPSPEKFNLIKSSLPPLYKSMSDDIERADHLLVNSEFVKETCVHVGVPRSKIHVVQLGVDDSFFQSLTARVPQKRAVTDLLFAGSWQRRKGVETLIDALELIHINWSITIAASLESKFARETKSSNFLKLSNVNKLGVVSRARLAKIMSEHRIFVFPSYCEGSARVVFEAMASGCYVITTPNTGSIVEDGVHGRLVQAGNIDELVDAIIFAINNEDLVDRIGKQNAIVVQNEYRQSQYGEKVRNLYTSLLSNRFGNDS